MGSIYLPTSFITLIYLSLPHYPFILMDFLHLGVDSKLLLWKLKTNEESEKQPWEAIKSTAFSYHLSDPKVLFILFTDACLKQYSACQNKSKIQDYRQAYYVGDLHINPPQFHGLRRKS